MKKWMIWRPHFRKPPYKWIFSRFVWEWIWDAHHKWIFPKKNHPFWSILGIPIYGHRHDFRSFWDLSKGACHLDALAGQPSRARTGGVIVYVSPKDCHLNRKHGWNWNTKYTMGSGCFLFRHWIFWMFFFSTKCSDKNKWGVYRTKPGAVFHPRDHTWSFERVIMCKKKKKTPAKAGRLIPNHHWFPDFFEWTQNNDVFF